GLPLGRVPSPFFLLPIRHLHLRRGRPRPQRGVSRNRGAGDHLRSPVATTDAKGRVVSVASYDAWGAQAGATVDPYAFTGHPLDAETGLYYAGARYFHP